jgi:hypothetical protein
MKNPPASGASAQADFAPPVHYTPEVEQVPVEEPETIAKISRMMVQMAEQVRTQHGQAMRATHAKATGLLKGELMVAGNLPPELAQGMFAQPGRYDVLARTSQGPSNPITDKAAGQRGLALKVLGVEGPHVAGSRETTTQDWVLAPDSVFITATAAGFLTNFRLGASNTPGLPEAALVGLSYAARGVEAALETVGLSVGTLKLLGREPLHPLGHAYYSQTPSRYGDYMAKVAAFPTPETLAILGTPHLDPGQDDNAFRTAMSQFFVQHGASFDLRVQMCTDLATMPIEDASIEWPEAQSPYRTVARLTFPPQASFGEARYRYFEQRLAFNPLHALEAHRPLGGIQRARGAAYMQTQNFRQHANQIAAAEPLSADDVPD